MTARAHTRTGAGEPLVLLHGIGSSRRAWDPVIPALAERFDVVAVDLPGFGDSEPLPPEVEPRPAALDPAAVTALITAASARGRPDVEPHGQLVPGTRAG